MGFAAAPRVGIGLTLTVSLKDDDEIELEENDEEWNEGSPRVVATWVI